MTRTQQIEAAAKQARQCLAGEGSPRRLLTTAVAILEEALALPPDPVPRRLTVEDLAALWPLIGLSDSKMANFLNDRIFGEQK